jgi:hypothetical protein
MRAIACVLLAVPGAAYAEPTATVYLDTNVAGDAESGRGGAGLAVAYYLHGRVGLELDVAYQFHFFQDEDVAHLVPERVDLDTRAVTALANLVAPIPIPRAPLWLPYASAGVGTVHAIFAADGPGGLDRSQTDLAVNAAVGLERRLTALVGLQVEGRYIRVFADGDSTTAGVLADYDVWRVSVGVTVGFPVSRAP